MEKEVTENAGTAFQESSGPDVKKGCETVTLLKKSEGFDAPVDPGSNAVKEEADKVGRQSKKSDNNSPSEEPEGDGQINNDHGEGSDETDENESDLEVIITRVAKNMVSNQQCPCTIYLCLTKSYLFSDVMTW